MITMKQIKEMKTKGYQEYPNEELAEALALVNVAKNELATIEGDLKDTLGKSMTVHDQLSINLGDACYTSKVVEVNDISFDISESDLYILCHGKGVYIKSSLDITSLKKDIAKKVSIDPEIAAHVVLTRQEEFKFSKKTIKEVK